MEDSTDSGYSGNFTGSMYGAPDVGTLGGTMSDDDGENSSTLGGTITPTQSGGNQEVNSSPWNYDFNAADFEVPGAMSLGSMFNYTSPTGLPTNGSGDYAGTIGNYGANDFTSSPFFKGLRTLLGMTPVGKVANLGIGAAMGESPVRAAAGMIPGIGGTLATAGYDASKSDNPAATLGNRALAYGGNMLGSTIGNNVAGPVGGLLGGQMVQAAMRSGGEASSNPNTPKGSGFDLGGTLQGLAGLYQGYKGGQLADQQQQNQLATQTALQTQMSNLADMYGPNSAYAKQLEQTLARKDAAAGRNSQYGPRAVQLQAALADKQAQAAQSMSSLANSSNAGYTAATAANNAAQTAQGQQLARLLALGKSTGVLDWAQQGLSGMFNNFQPQVQSTPFTDNTEWA